MFWTCDGSEMQASNILQGKVTGKSRGMPARRRLDDVKD